MIRVETKNGVVQLNAPMSAVPVLRLLQWHSPTLRVECLKDGGPDIQLVTLGSLILDQPSLVALNKKQATETVNVDRAQLAKLGGVPEAALVR